MNKAKAIFAGVVVAAIAGTTAVCWYLNDKGIIGTDAESTDADSGYYQSYDDGENNNENGEGNNENQNGEETTSSQTDSENNEDDEVSASETVKINSYLSIFSSVYFSEDDGGYSQSNHSSYELIRFAYARLKLTDRSEISAVVRNDDIGSYFSVPYDKVNEIVENNLGISVSKESVYTEQKYKFFKYEDGYFYTPAADGVGFVNVAVVDSVTENNGELSVSFTVYSDGATSSMTSEEAHKKGTKYASGTATIKSDSGEYTLLSYKISKSE